MRSVWHNDVVLKNKDKSMRKIFILAIGLLIPVLAWAQPTPIANEVALILRDRSLTEPSTSCDKGVRKRKEVS